MKNLLFTIFVFSTLEVNAQNYLIDFAGTGGSITVNSVKVENLTKATSLTLNSGDILQLTLSTGINYSENTKVTHIKVWPNPAKDDCIIQFEPENSGEAVFTIFDVTGKQVYQKSMFLAKNMQEYKISGLKKGLNFISLKGKTFQYSTKVLNIEESQSTLNIERTGSKPIQTNDLKMNNAKGLQATVEMDYSTGDRIKFTGISGNFSTVLTDIPTEDKTITFNFRSCTDGDNNNYPIVSIGTQTWMAENLKATKYNNGTAITLVTDNTAWSNLSTGAYCWYDNNQSAYGNIYGALYNFYTINSGILCPLGWHVPNDSEWMTLLNYLVANSFNFDGTSDFNKVTKSIGATTNWLSSIFPGSVGSTEYPAKRNATGLTALPGGQRYGGSGIFNGLTTYTAWWTRVLIDTNSAYIYSIAFGGENVTRTLNGKRSGLSVRCIYD